MNQHESQVRRVKHEVMVNSHAHAIQGDLLRNAQSVFFQNWGGSQVSEKRTHACRNAHRPLNGPFLEGLF